MIEISLQIFLQLSCPCESVSIVPTRSYLVCWPVSVWKLLLLVPDKLRYYLCNLFYQNCFFLLLATSRRKFTQKTKIRECLNATQQYHIPSCGGFTLPPTRSVAFINLVWRLPVTHHQTRPPDLWRSARWNSGLIVGRQVVRPLSSEQMPRRLVGRTTRSLHPVFGLVAKCVTLSILLDEIIFFNKGLCRT